MRELHFGTGVLVVSFDVCAAVFDYAAALASAGRADVVNVPILLDGRLADSNLVLTPSSQLYCLPAPTDFSIDFGDEDVVSEIRRREARLVSRARAAVAGIPHPHFAIEFD